jgi:hypothetical protein
MHRMVLLVTWGKGKLVSVCLEIVLVLVQDGCTICTECTTSMEIILGTLDGTPSYVGQGETRFGLLGNSVSLGAR